MKIGIFFTFDYSLETLDSSGLLERELAIYSFLSRKYGIRFTLFTYGNANDYQLMPEIPGIEIFPMYEHVKRNNNKYLRVIKSIAIPILIKKEIKKQDFLHQHQLTGFWVPFICKLFYKIPIYTRTGYDTYNFSIKQKNSVGIKSFFKLLTFLALRFSNIYTVTSKEDFLFLKSKFKINKTVLLIRPNWVDYKSNNVGSISDRILCVGRLVDQKNYPLLLREFSNNINNLTLDIVGSGPLENVILELAEELNVKINLLGVMSHDELSKLYAKYRFFITSSTFEGNPKSVLEAMGSGCVVIASKIPAHEEIITHMKDGILFDIEKPELKHLFSELKANPEVVLSISKNAINRVENNNSISKISKDTYLDYLSLMELKI
jgi:glycosyltransferase involved in cell wall biosynthesis